jgi:hypothetical protein
MLQMMIYTTSKASSWKRSPLRILNKERREQNKTLTKMLMKSTKEIIMKKSLLILTRQKHCLRMSLSKKMVMVNLQTSLFTS